MSKMNREVKTSEKIKSRISVFLCAAAFLAMAGICQGQANENDIWNRDTLTSGF